MEDRIASVHILSRTQRRLLMGLFDAFLLCLSLWMAYSLRFGEWFVPVPEQALLFAALPVIAIPVFARLGLYRAVMRYLGEQALWAVVKAVALATLIWALLAQLSGMSGLIHGVPRTVTVLFWVLATVLTLASRVAVRELVWRPVRSRFSGDNVLVYGAGEAGVQLVNALYRANSLYPVAFIDDDQHLHNREIAGLKVYPLTQLGELIERFGVREVLLAIPSASRARHQEIIRRLEKFPVHARVLPAVSEIAEGKISVGDLREVEIEDLLGRDAVPPNQALLRANIADKCVLVTGAGGSIGSELCRQVVQLAPKRLILLDHGEHALYEIDRQLRLLRPAAGRVEIVPVLGSVLNRGLLDLVMRKYAVQTVYHAAAYKHVPLLESNEIEGVQNNVLGTLAVAEAALRARVETCVLISTDKAVRPTNMMGASKRFAELILQAMHSRFVADGKAGRPIFSMVRFGNVLGSSGSVIPLFREQIRAGGPVTVTHPLVTRYFMSIPEAAQLVIQAGAMAQGGDVFVLDMGEPVRIYDLARQMIHLSGLEVQDELNPGGDIRIECIGLRPGEKLYEELLIGDNPMGTEHPKIMRAKEEMLSWEEVQVLLSELRTVIAEFDLADLRRLMMRAVKGYQPDAAVENPASQARVIDLKKPVAAGAANLVS